MAETSNVSLEVLLNGGQMAETSDVSLVRCPNCENVLPEPPGYSVYQCGGCMAVLRAKKKELLDNILLETSGDDDHARGVSDKGDLDNVGLNSVSGVELENNGIFKRNDDERIVLNGSSSAGVETRRVLDDLGGSRRGRERLNLGVGQDRKTRYSKDEYKHYSKGPIDEYVRDNSDCDINTNRPEKVKLNKDELEEVRHLVKSMRSRPMMEQSGLDRNSLRESRVNARSFAGQGRYVQFHHPDVGPSNCVRGSNDGYGERMRYVDGSDGLARVENLENDRIELLRKLDELADQLTRSCKVADRPRERAQHERGIPPLPPDTRDAHDTFVLDCMGYSYGVNKQPLAPDTHVSGAPYVTHNHSYLPDMDRHGIPFQDSYRMGNFAYEYGGISDVYQPQMLRRSSNQPPTRYFQESCYEHFPGYHMDFNQDLSMPREYDTFFHQAACSCLHCVKKNWHVSSKTRPPNLCTRNIQNTYPNRNLYQHVDPLTYDPQGHSSEASNLLPPQSCDRKHLTRSSSDLGREKVGFGHSHFKKVISTKGNKRFFHPIAGGAPFITCCNCFELLKLPGKLLLTQKNHRKIKCGDCSSVLLFELDGKGIIISVPATSEQVFKKDHHASSSEIPDEKNRSSQDFLDTEAIFNYNDYENLNYNSELADAQPVLSSGDHQPNFDGSVTRQDHNSSTSGSDEDVQSPDSVIARKEAYSAEFPSKNEVFLPDSPSQRDPGHSPHNLMHKYDHENRSKRIDEDGNIAVGKTSRQNSLKDPLVATEMDVSYNDHFGLTHDSTDLGKDEDLPRITKGGESFFIGFIKRSLGDFSRSSKSTESGKPNVSINGHFIPDRVVKKVEKLSGTIQPGDYWYDIRAGFWGVMGHPCLGIIPPNIEGFNYPMAGNCAGGNTEVFVNGRELHQKDLDLLASRGLPVTRHKYYIIHISGRVVDEDTGEELDGLGKLAPTVEREKRGFGMRIPKSLLQNRNVS